MLTGLRFFHIQKESNLNVNDLAVSSSCTTALAKSVIDNKAECKPYLSVVAVEVPEDVPRQGLVRRISPSHTKLHRCTGQFFKTIF